MTDFTIRNNVLKFQGHDLYLVALFARDPLTLRYFVLCSFPVIQERLGLQPLIGYSN